MSWVKNGIRDNDVVILDTRGRIDSFWCHKKFSELAEETVCWSGREAGYLFQKNDKRVISCLLHCSHAVASRGACLCFIRWSTRWFADLICHEVIRGPPDVGPGIRRFECRTSQLVGAKAWWNHVVYFWWHQPFGFNVGLRTTPRMSLCTLNVPLLTCLDKCQVFKALMLHPP